ncbi:hypothetical protein LCGC14_0971560 [marine sediment metagenome]|uniref:Uncharacterized protein n=1 Tax=marine sediment metagenome TaxID=412755 RepID=A0A0F9RHX0_9ZZZZ
MATRVLPISHWNEGLSSSEKEGPPGSFAFGRSLDIHSEPTSTKILPKTAKISTTVVDGLLKWFVKAGDGFIYGYDDAGAIYENNAGTVTKKRTVSNSSGNGLTYFEEDDYLYYALDKVIGRYGPLASSPTFDDDFFSGDIYDKDQTNSASGQTYTLTTSINEGATHKQQFTPKKDPQKSVEVNVDTVGTGNWTLTVHDERDNSIATLTIANGSVSTGDQKFTFASVWRTIIGQTYHFHLTSTVADGIVVTGTASDLEDADFTTFFQILVNNTNFHPMIGFKIFTIFGNEDYIGKWDGFTDPIDSNAIALPRGFKCRSLAKVGEYVVAGCWRDSSITDNESGLLVFWDGVDAGPNYSIEIPDGPVQAMVANQGRLFFIAGAQANLMVEADGIQKIRELPKITNQTNAEIGPGAMSSWQTLIAFGAAFSTDSTSIEQGVYTFGQKDKNYGEALNYAFPISTGTRTGTSLKIGAVLGQGDTLHIGWKDGADEGWDTVTSSSNPFATAVWESLIFDDETPFKEKMARYVIIHHTGLASNETVQAGYDIDRSGSFTTGTANSTSGSISTRLDINKRFREIQLSVNLAASSTTATITSIVFEFEGLEDEERE